MLGVLEVRRAKGERRAVSVWARGCSRSLSRVLSRNANRQRARGRVDILSSWRHCFSPPTLTPGDSRLVLQAPILAQRLPKIGETERVPREVTSASVLKIKLHASRFHRVYPPSHPQTTVASRLRAFLEILVLEPKTTPS